jgi:hypothetical protein
MDTPGIVKFPTSLDSADSLVQVGNGLVTTLSVGLATGQTSIVVVNASSWPLTGIATIQKRVTATVGSETVFLPTGPVEIVNFERSGNTLTITRAQQGTSDIPHDAGDYIECRITAKHHEVLRDAVLAVETELQSSLISLVWASPSTESGDAIEIAASCVGFAGQAFVSGLVDVKIVVSDGAGDASPSHTATINPAIVPVGTITEGSGTATATVRTNNSGHFKISISETATASRYLWVTTGGHSRLWVRSSTGVQQLTFV